MEKYLFWEYQNGPIHLVGWHLYYLIALFSILTWVLGRFLFTPVLAIVAERADRVAKAEKEAEAARKELEDQSGSMQQGLLDARREAFLLREEAQKAASGESDSRLAKTREDVQKKIADAMTRLEAQMAESRTGLKSEAEELGRAIALRVLGRKEA